MSDEFDMQDDDGHIDNSDLDFRSGKRARDDDDEDHEPVDEEEPEEELVIQAPPPPKERKRRIGPRGKFNNNRAGQAGGGMSVERWIFFDGLRVGTACSFDDYLDILPERLIQIMTRQELTAFYDVLIQMGGYIAVQSKKRWQQVVKNCNFAQTTSSSYSTRNKYESYLLAKEIHDYLWGIMGRSEEIAIDRGMLRLAEICLCHFEQVEGASSKKNLLEPLQEMLVHSPAALQALVVRLAAPSTEDEMGYALLVVRSMSGKTHQHHLAAAVQAMPAVRPALVAYIQLHAADPGKVKCEELVMAGVVLAIAVRDQDDPIPEDAASLAGAFDLLMSLHVADAYMGRTMLHRLSHTPLWLLARLDLAALLAATRTSLDAAANVPQELSGLPQAFVRLLTRVLMAADPVAVREESNWEEILGVFAPYAQSGNVLERSMRALLAAFVSFRPIFTNWICEQLHVNNVAEVEEDYDDDSSDDRRNMEGKRRIMSSASLSRKKAKLKEEEERKNRSKNKGSEDESNVEDYDPNETDSQRAKRARKVAKARGRKKGENSGPGPGRKPKSAGAISSASASAPTKRARKSRGMDDGVRGGPIGAVGKRGGKRGAIPSEAVAALAEKDEELHAARLQSEMRVMAAEARLVDREIELAEHMGATLVAQGNARFWSGQAEQYSTKQCVLVRANAEAVLKRIAAVEKLAVDSPLHECVVCRVADATHYPNTCMCLAYCETCVHDVHACAVCGFDPLKLEAY